MSDMKNSNVGGKFSKVLGIAVAGIIAGAAMGCGKTDEKAATTTEKAGEKSACSGKSGCKSSPENANIEKHACKGKNSCKGQGGCATDKNSCAGKNACKGQGGCNTMK